MAKIKPLFKKGNSFDPMNYRHISLLSGFSKILERLFNDRLSFSMQIMSSQMLPTLWFLYPHFGERLRASLDWGWRAMEGVGRDFQLESSKYVTRNWRTAVRFRITCPVQSIIVVCPVWRVFSSVCRNQAGIQMESINAIKRHFDEVKSV